ncbi:alpha-amylase family glycosyl hydrolase [Streptomyces sp. NBC_00557]|uniref:alpha-amylase family glycosyl hydrolase n=1 Tax=Streptomyces sp. NBC_00557 TaxID=2975776 RepID=UPI003FCDDA99
MSGAPEGQAPRRLSERPAVRRRSTARQLYGRSFADSDGDGVGDIPGALSRLDDLAWLGVDAIWGTAVNASSDYDQRVPLWSVRQSIGCVCPISDH